MLKKGSLVGCLLQQAVASTQILYRLSNNHHVLQGALDAVGVINCTVGAIKIVGVSPVEDHGDVLPVFFDLDRLLLAHGALGDIPDTVEGPVDLGALIGGGPDVGFTASVELAGAASAPAAAIGEYVTVGSDADIRV